MLNACNVRMNLIVKRMALLVGRATSTKVLEYIYGHMTLCAPSSNLTVNARHGIC